MFEVFLDASHGKEWQRIYREIESGNDFPGFDDVFKGYGAAVDAPASEVWPWILKQYPDIKVSGVSPELVSCPCTQEVSAFSGNSDSPPWARMEEKHEQYNSEA